MGSRVASPNDNFIFFGANCKEDHKVVQIFTKQLLSDIARIESKIYLVDNRKVTFSFELVPSDMKFLAFLNGELSNAATYFSSFANVSKADSCLLGKEFGTAPTCKWKPWSYAERLNVAKKVANFKKKLSNKVSEKTNRSKVTNFIASNHSRQEFLPLIGKLSDKVMVEPLHLKNNGSQQLHAMFLQQVLSICSLPFQLNSISELPHTSPMSKYLVAMECQVKATRLKKQLVKWLMDERTRNKDFTYRFTGKDSKLFLHGFMYLLNAIKGDSNDLKQLAKLLFF